MRPYLVLLAFICAVLSSCKDELYQDKGGNPEDYPASSADPSLEALHSLQTDQQIMLSSMIRYNASDRKYVLDLSLRDAESLGISKETYEEAKSLVSKMN